MRISDWSSDVCSSDLSWDGQRGIGARVAGRTGAPERSLFLGRCRRVRTGAINCLSVYLPSIRRFPPHGGRYILHALAQAGHDASHGPPSPAGLPRSTTHPRFQEHAVAVESQIGPLPIGKSNDVTAESILQTH